MSKWLNFFWVHWEKKMSHFDLQSWVTGGTKIWPNFLGQNYLIFSSQCNEKKNLSHFDLKSWVTGGTKIRPNFLGQNDPIFSLSALRWKLSHFDFKSWVTGEIIIRLGKVSNWRIFESIWILMLSQFDSQCWINLTLNVEPIWLSTLSQSNS